MLIDLDLTAKDALVIGRGREAEFKATRLLDGKAKVTVLGLETTPRLEKLANRGKLELVRTEPTLTEARGEIQRRRPRVVFICTGDPGLDERLARMTRSSGALTCVVDTPRLNDFNMPAIAAAGDIRIAISTGGSSPAMASLLRRRLEEMIDEKDVLHVRLQKQMRRLARGRLPDAESRKEFAYEIINDSKINSLLKERRYDKAKRRARAILDRKAAAALPAISSHHAPPRADRDGGEGGNSA